MATDMAFSLRVHTFAVDKTTCVKTGGQFFGHISSKLPLIRPTNPTFTFETVNVSNVHFNSMKYTIYFQYNSVKIISFSFYFPFSFIQLGSCSSQVFW